MAGIAISGESHVPKLLIWSFKDLKPNMYV